MQLYGPLRDVAGSSLKFEPRLAAALDHADKIYAGINASIDKFIAERGIDAPPGGPYVAVWKPAVERTELDLATSGITSVIWCIGFAPDFRWLDAAVFNGSGHPQHLRGVTRQEGLYFLGLP